MVKLTEQQINKFKKLYYQEYGNNISFAEAQNELSKIIDLIALVHRPLKKYDIEKIKKN